ncbi:hypothetical protein CYLTODRAFT_66662 [Cylindrobasidium torrendii FP15055 ss-10]|uniref:RGS domain-containing protein n=1 Tax=Cylindrobasidium torrendii FP15055 ss-10 TaxID=1314674 RepID=A0A0D7B577_9AGAR|nr:hypothetical protein CYLTODRAFT_66662 [Cylindrobasidium torrendii FP15055 ss-10]
MLSVIWTVISALAFANNLLNIDPPNPVHRIPYIVESVLGIAQTLESAKQIYSAATLKWASAEEQLAYCEQLEDLIFNRVWTIPSEATEAIQFAPWIPPMLLCDQISRHNATVIVPWNTPNLDWLRLQNGTARANGLADWMDIAALLRRADKNIVNSTDAHFQVPLGSVLDTLFIAFVGKDVEIVPIPAEETAPVPAEETAPIAADLKTQCPRSLALEIQRLCPSGGEQEFFEADGFEIISPLFQLLFWAPVILAVITAFAAIVCVIVSLRSPAVAAAGTVPSSVVVHEESGEVVDRDRDCPLENDADSDKNLSSDSIVSPPPVLPQAVINFESLPSVEATIPLAAKETDASTTPISSPEIGISSSPSTNVDNSSTGTATPRQESPPISPDFVALAYTVARINSPYTPPAHLPSPELTPRMTTLDEIQFLSTTAPTPDVDSSHTTNQEPEIVSLSLPALNPCADVFVPPAPARCPSPSPAEKRQALLLQLRRKFEKQFARHVYLNALAAHPDVMNRFYTFCVDLQEQNPCDMDAFNELVLAEQILQFINKDEEGRTAVIKAFARLIGPLTSVKFVLDSPSWSPEPKFLAIFEEDEDLEDPRHKGSFDFLDDGGYSLVDNRKHAVEWERRIKEFRNKRTEECERMEEFTLPQLKAFCESNRLDVPQKAYSGRMRLMGYGTRRLQRARFRSLVDQDALSSFYPDDERRTLAESFMALEEDWQAGCLIQDDKGNSKQDIEDRRSGKKSFEVWLRFFLDCNDQRPKLTTENLADLDAQSGNDLVPAEDDAESDTSSDRRFMDEIKAMGEANSKAHEASTSGDTLDDVPQPSAVLTSEGDQTAPTPLVAATPVEASVEPAPAMITEPLPSPLPVAEEGVAVNDAGTVKEEADSPVPPLMDEAEARLVGSFLPLTDCLANPSSFRPRGRAKFLPNFATWYTPMGPSCVHPQRKSSMITCAAMFHSAR